VTNRLVIYIIFLAEIFVVKGYVADSSLLLGNAESTSVMIAGRSANVEV
jgi:hypothetical protein